MAGWFNRFPVLGSSKGWLVHSSGGGLLGASVSISKRSIGIFLSWWMRDGLKLAAPSADIEKYAPASAHFGTDSDGPLNEWSKNPDAKGRNGFKSS